MSALEIIITLWLATLLETKFILAGMRIAEKAYVKLAGAKGTPVAHLHRIVTLSPLAAGAVGRLGYFAQNKEGIVGWLKSYP